MDDIIKTVESLEKSNLLIDCVTETVKYEIKKQENGFLGAMMAPLVALLIPRIGFFIDKTREI